VYSPESVLGMPDYKTYRAKYHTSTSELAEIANRAKPGILVFYHTSGRGPNGRIPYEQLLREIQKTYRGRSGDRPRPRSILKKPGAPPQCGEEY